MTETRTGYFVVADITGYTVYLRDTELDHAQSILTSLLTLLLERTHPPLIVSRTAGDAVVSYAFDQPFVTGQTFVEIIESTYVAFRRAIELMVLNTTCQCNACRGIEMLDLKFFVHHGGFGVQRLDGHDELVGADVVVLHRLLKNRVVEDTGIQAYCLYTDAAVEAMRFARPLSVPPSTTTGSARSSRGSRTSPRSGSCVVLTSRSTSSSAACSSR